MKLGFLLFHYFPYGGLQRDCLKIARLCAQRGHEIVVFTRTWEGPTPDRQRDSLEPERPVNVPAQGGCVNMACSVVTKQSESPHVDSYKGTVRVELFGQHGLSNIARNRAWLRQLEQRLPEEKLDATIGFNKLPGLDIYYGSDPCFAAKTRRLNPWWYEWLPRYRHYLHLEKSVFARGKKTQILLLTDREIDSYQEFYGTEDERFHLLPPGIERRTFSATARDEVRRRIRMENSWAADERLLLLVGSGFRVKGLDRAIRSLAVLPEPLRGQTRLVVIGQNRASDFQRLARRLGVQDRVSFLGGRNDVYDWQLASDLLIHPARSEAAGMVLLEALTAGLPVLCTDVCGYSRHIVRANAGCVLPSPFSQDQCNAELVTMLTSPLRRQWMENALAYVAREDLYTCHDTAVDLIESLLQGALRTQRKP